MGEKGGVRNESRLRDWTPKIVVAFHELGSKAGRKMIRSFSTRTPRVSQINGELKLGSFSHY